eukprot:15152_1
MSDVINSSIKPFEIFNQSNQTCRNMINGFLREHQEKYFGKIQNAYFNIPKIVCHLCISFMYEPIMWDENCKGYTIKIIENSVIHDNGPNSDYYGNAFITGTAKNGVHIWKFKIHKVCPHTWNLIGIWKTRFLKPSLTTYFTNIDDNGYAFVVNFGYLTHPQAPGRKGNAYTNKCKEGDIIQMILNFRNCSLSFMVNEKVLGKAFDIEHTEYKAVATLIGADTKFTLCSYQHFAPGSDRFS